MRARFAAGIVLALLALLAGCEEKKSESSGPSGPPPPPPEKLAAALAELNALCADTWCEGGYHFTFRKLECASAIACTLSFDATHDESGRSTMAALPLAGFDTVLDPAGSPTETFENAVNDAIAEWETKQGG